MKVLIINCGSSSLKYQLIDSETEKVLAKGLCERIGIEGGMLSHTASETPEREARKIEKAVEMPDHVKAVELVIECLTDKEYGVIGSLEDIDAVGHRLVHGGERFSEATLITDEVIKAIEECNDLAPLHNPANLTGIRSCRQLMPEVPMVGVFDTAFHQTMPKKAYLYGIPYEYYEKYKIRRYGFHGTSHSYVSKRAAEILHKNYQDFKVIVCHLGNGASVSAVKNGQCVDTSMGLTPLEGLFMGTRSGDLDPAILEFICNKENLSISEMLTILNKKSGVLGLSKLSSDFRDLIAAANDGNELARTTLEAYSYRVAKYIGAYTAAMNGVDAIVFTAGIGENNSDVRQLVGDYLSYLGTGVDRSKNDVRGKEAVISYDEARIPILIVPTNEELAIARETVKVLGR
ncbi:MAG TPA: acetate kinase [Lachnospiraceae bacterium]|nr:acetate kinase [Lachnospiraceae bacterium]